MNYKIALCDKSVLYKDIIAVRTCLTEPLWDWTNLKIIIKNYVPGYKILVLTAYMGESSQFPNPELSKLWS